ncbi:MAG: hypothetical protein GPJ20_16045 [Microcystis aeruginosa BS13-10]|nr:hypothetical protein [Microcystis aeruginosa BS13-10]
MPKRIVARNILSAKFNSNHQLNSINISKFITS